MSVIYENESGGELWRSALAEVVPPGTLVTSADGTRYLVAKVTRHEDLDGPGESRITLRLYRQ